MSPSENFTCNCSFCFGLIQQKNSIICIHEYLFIRYPLIHSFLIKDVSVLTYDSKFIATKSVMSYLMHFLVLKRLLYYKSTFYFGKWINWTRFKNQLMFQKYTKYENIKLHAMRYKLKRMKQSITKLRYYCVCAWKFLKIPSNIRDIYITGFSFWTLRKEYNIKFNKLVGCFSICIHRDIVKLNITFSLYIWKRLNIF